MSEGYGLVLAFDTDDPEFCRGVEIGRLWEALKDERAFGMTIRASNVEMVMRMAESTRRRMTVEDSPDEYWCFLDVEERDGLD